MLGCCKESPIPLHLALTWPIKYEFLLTLLLSQGSIFSPSPYQMLPPHHRHTHARTRTSSPPLSAFLLFPLTSSFLFLLPFLLCLVQFILAALVRPLVDCHLLRLILKQHMSFSPCLSVLHCTYNSQRFTYCTSLPRHRLLHEARGLAFTATRLADIL